MTEAELEELLARLALLQPGVTDDSTDVSDEEIAALLDQQLSDEHRAKVMKALRHHPEWYTLWISTAETSFSDANSETGQERQTEATSTTETASSSIGARIQQLLDALWWPAAATSLVGGLAVLAFVAMFPAPVSLQINAGSFIEPAPVMRGMPPVAQVTIESPAEGDQFNTGNPVFVSINNSAAVPLDILLTLEGRSIRLSNQVNAKADNIQFELVFEDPGEFSLQVLTEAGQNQTRFRVTR